MRNLVQPAPSMRCELCDSELRFKRIEPDDLTFADGESAALVVVIAGEPTSS